MQFVCESFLYRVKLSISDDDGSTSRGAAPTVHNAHKHTLYNLTGRTDAVRHVLLCIVFREKLHELVLVVFVVVYVLIEVGDVASETR